jgi:hypothetical protein
MFVSSAKLSLPEKIAELAGRRAADQLTADEARACMENLRQAFPDFDRFMERRFARLPEPHQRFMLELLQEANFDASVAWIEAWSRSSDLPLAIRAHAGTVLERLGKATDRPYYTALQQTAMTLEHLRDEATEGLTADGTLASRWQQAVLDLPLALALDLAQELAPDYPALALAVLQALRPIVDANDCPTLVRCLGQIPLPEAAATLQGMLAETTDKTLQKTIKKALHRLRAQGVAFDDIRPRSHNVVVGTVTHQLERCLASHIDGAGDRALWMIRRRPFGGYNIAYLVVNYGTGLQAALGLQANKRELPDLLGKAQEHFRLIDLDPAYCQFQVNRAHQWNLETNTPVPEEFFGLRDIIGDEHPVFDQAIIYSALSEDDLREAQAYTDHAADLLDLPEFAGWTLPASVIQKYGDMLRDIDDSSIVVSDAVKQDRVNEIYARATEEILSVKTRNIMRLRLEEMAYYLLQTERRLEALWAVAAAQSLSVDDPVRLRRHPFIGALLDRSLQRAKEQPSRRIVLPFSHPSESSEESRLII